MATAEGRKQHGLTALYQVLVPWVQRTLAEQYGADWVRNPVIAATLGAKGFSTPVDAEKYIRSQTLQAITVLWNPVFSRVLQPSDLELIRQLLAAERAHLDDLHVDALLDAMATLVTHANMPNEAARFKRLKRDSGFSGLSKGVEGAAMIGGLLAADKDAEDEDRESPFICPITLQIMKDPVITPQGICFERQAIVDWIAKSHTCPITQKPLSVDQLITCYALRAAIEEYQKLRNSKSDAQPKAQNENAQSESAAPASSSSNPVPQRIQRAIHHGVRPLINVEVVPRFQNQVKCLTALQLRGEDTYTQYPEASKYITFPASQNYLVSRSTGFVVIENRGDFEVTLISRQREGNLWEPANEGGRLCGSYALGPHQVQGFDYRGWYCIEVPPDLNNRPIDLLVTDYSQKGGGKGAWLRMGTGGAEFRD